MSGHAIPEKRWTWSQDLDITVIVELLPGRLAGWTSNSTPFLELSPVALDRPMGRFFTRVPNFFCVSHSN